jgi:hypothetical protein
MAFMLWGPFKMTSEGGPILCFLLLFAFSFFAALSLLPLSILTWQSKSTADPVVRRGLILSLLAFVLLGSYLINDAYRIHRIQEKERRAGTDLTPGKNQVGRTGAAR